MKQKSILSNGATREKLEVRKNTMGRQENIEIFEDTFALCKRNSTLRDAIEQSAKKQKLYPKGVECTEKQAITYAQPAKIIVSPKRTLEAAMPYAYAGKKVCIHNFASAANPGGGVTKGSSDRKRQSAAAPHCIRISKKKSFGRSSMRPTAASRTHCTMMTASTRRASLRSNPIPHIPSYYQRTSGILSMY